MNHDAPAYGLWLLVVLNSAVFIIFAFSFTKPRSARDWRSFGAFAAFLVALFTEMYGFPLTIYLLAGWLGRRYPGPDLLSHDAGHLWNTLLGWRGDAHLHPLHILSSLLIGGGFLLLAAAWSVLYEAQRQHTLAVTGPYAHIRHPQYAGFILIMLGFLFQWVTLAGVQERLRRLSAGTWVMAIVAWLTVITGTYIVYPWYWASPPAGAELLHFPRAHLLANPNLAAWHTFGMEWKEHVSWLCPILATSVAAVVVRYGPRLASEKQIRLALMVLFTLAFLTAGAGALFGALITKVVPIH